MSVLSKFFKAASGDNYCVRTGLKSLSGTAEVILSVDVEKDMRVRKKIEIANGVNLSDTRLKHLDIMDEYKSSLLNGNNTTLDKVISGENSNAERYVHRLVDALYYINVHAPSFDSISFALQTASNKYDERIEGAQVNRLAALMRLSEASDIINAAVNGFYLSYMDLFSSDNDSIARIVMKWWIGVPGLQLSTAIQRHEKEYVHCLMVCSEEKDGVLNITPFYDFMRDMIEEACDSFIRITEPLDGMQTTLVQKIKEQSRAYLTVGEASTILGEDETAAKKVLDSLCESGYMELDPNTDKYKSLWK